MAFSFRPWEAALDRWSSLDFKKAFNGIISPVDMPMWVPEDDQRRLRAYGLFESYVKNKARIWINSVYSDTGTTDYQDRREYGDAALIVKTTRASLLGEEWSIVTTGAQGEREDIKKEAAEAQHRFIEEWADKEKFSIKLMESEEQSIKFGDSVYVLGYDEKKGRVRMNVYDPGFYFPQFSDRESGGEDFPTEVWIAWEFEEENALGETKKYVRRMAWWFPEDEGDETCWYEDAVWELEDAVAQVPFNGEPDEWLTEPVSLGVDFIPVIHVPNTPGTQEHFGESLLSDVLQILDDTSGTDTDLQAAAATTGSPPIAIEGLGDNEQTSYGPGTVLRTGEGKATLLDTSKSLDALLKLKDALLERLATNSRVPESLLGRVKPNEVPSGIALTLSFTPHAGLVKEMRMVRDYKYRLLFRFVILLSRVNNVPDSGDGEETFETMLKFGSFLPADAQEAMTVVTQLLEAKAISRETAVKYLVDHGYPISDWVEEIDRIASRDLEYAQGVAGLTGNPAYAAGLLGIPSSAILAFDDDEDAEEEPVEE